MNPTVIKQFQEFQEEFKKAKREIKNMIFTCSSGGIVTVEVSGSKALIRITVDPEFRINSVGDKEMLEDAICAACANAYEEIKKYEKEKIGKLGAFATALEQFE
jgi:DNA-binding YbaB/EbfC family protein